MSKSSYIFLFSLFCYLNGERLHEQIYSSIVGSSACFRILNGTHQAGCSSSFRGSVGVVQMIRDLRDAQWIVSNGTAGPYTAVVSTALFYDVIKLFLKHPDNVAGVLLFDNATDSATSLSPESRCPNEYSAAEGSQCSSISTIGSVWNEKGMNLLRSDIPFPMYYLPDSRVEEITKIEDCYERFNADKQNQNGMPLCSVQLNSFMYAAVSSEVCMRRSATSALLNPAKVCDPLADRNVYYSLFPRAEMLVKESVILVTARIDSASLFDGVSPGAASSVVGMVTLITAAATLAKMVPSDKTYEKNVLWTLFNGESFDYIGSQRVAFDLAAGLWPFVPLDPNYVALHVELGQIGGSLLAHINDTTWPFYALAFPQPTAIPQINEFVNEMNLQNTTVTLEYTSNMPPSSLHSFRRILQTYTVSGDLPELLIVDHKKTFTNMFYLSALDEYSKIGFNYHNISVDSNGTFITTEELLGNGTMTEMETQVKISRLATSLARTLYKQVVGIPYSGNYTASAHLVDEMLYCFLLSQSCRLLRAADYASGAEEKVSDTPAPLYVGVAAWANTAPVFAGHLLALLAGNHLTVNRSQCDSLQQPGYSQYWLRGWNRSGVCIQTTMNFSDALSPAFILPDYDMGSGLYSTWTESVWQTLGARVFVAASGQGARVAAASGALATLVAAIITYWLQKHANLVFNSSNASIVINDDAASGILRTVNC